MPSPFGPGVTGRPKRSLGGARGDRALRGPARPASTSTSSSSDRATDPEFGLPFSNLLSHDASQGSRSTTRCRSVARNTNRRAGGRRRTTVDRRTRREQEGQSPCPAPATRFTSLPKTRDARADRWNSHRGQRGLETRLGRHPHLGLVGNERPSMRRRSHSAIPSGCSWRRGTRAQAKRIRAWMRLADSIRAKAPEIATTRTATPGKRRERRQHDDHDRRRYRFEAHGAVSRPKSLAVMRPRAAWRGGRRHTADLSERRVLADGLSGIACPNRRAWRGVTSSPSGTANGSRIHAPWVTRGTQSVPTRAIAWRHMQRCPAGRGSRLLSGERSGVPDDGRAGSPSVTSQGKKRDPARRLTSPPPGTYGRPGGGRLSPRSSPGRPWMSRSLSSVTRRLSG